MVHHSIKLLLYVVILTTYLQTCCSFSSVKKYEVMKDTTGKTFMSSAQWKIIKSNEVTFNECSVSLSKNVN